MATDPEQVIGRAINPGASSIHSLTLFVLTHRGKTQKTTNERSLELAQLSQEFKSQQEKWELESQKLVFVNERCTVSKVNHSLGH